MAVRPAFTTNTLRTMARPAVFGPTVRALGTIPQPPGNIVGTVNDPVPIKPVDRVHGSYLWSFERTVSAGLVPLLAVPFAYGSLSPVWDAVFGSLLIIHTHTGLESCITDYIPARTYGSLHNVAMYALWTGSIAALIGLYEFETNDVGITEALRKVWNS